MELKVGKKIDTENLSYSGFVVPKGTTVRIAVYSNGDEEQRQIVSLELTEDLDIDNDYPMKGKIISVVEEE